MMMLCAVLGVVVGAMMPQNMKRVIEEANKVKTYQQELSEAMQELKAIQLKQE